MSQIDQGIVTIKLRGESFQLRPTITAIKRISGALGGLAGALNRVQAVDIDAIVTIVRHGIAADDKLAKSLDQMIYETGPINILSDLVTYLTYLSNGGRPPSVEDASAGEDQGQADA